jgi:hypothetical protein
MKLTARSIAIGIFITLVLLGFSYIASAFGFTQIAHILYWQGWGLQFLVPCLNIGTVEKPFCEGSPLDVIAFFAGIPLGFVLYSVAAYFTLLARRHHAV